MSTAPITTDRRAARAAAIVQAGDIHESKPGVWRVRDRAGSGTWHHVTKTTCDCADFQRNGYGSDCKHLLAVKQAANWSTRQAPSAELPGNFLDSDFSAFDDVVLTLPAGPTCPTCASGTHPETRWAGKHGWLRFAICDRNGEHKGVRL